MKTEIIIKRLSKFGKVDHNDINNYFVKINNHFIEFFNQNGLVICLKVRKEDDENDIQSDYSAGVFVKTLKSALNSVGVKDG